VFEAMVSMSGYPSFDFYTLKAGRKTTVSGDHGAHHGKYHDHP